MGRKYKRTVELLEYLLYIMCHLAPSLQTRWSRLVQILKGPESIFNLSRHPEDCLEKSAAGLALDFKPKLDFFPTTEQKRNFIKHTMHTLSLSVVPKSSADGSDYLLATIHSLKGFETVSIYICSDVGEFYDNGKVNRKIPDL